jgi:hypothetical protein
MLLGTSDQQPFSSTPLGAYVKAEFNSRQNHHASRHYWHTQALGESSAKEACSAVTKQIAPDSLLYVA